MKKPKVLFYDIETAPILAYVWSLWDQNVGLNQIKEDWHVLSWAAKWLDKKKVMYEDQRNKKDISDDKELLKGIWKLLDEADVVVTQNGKKFDQKKLNARFVIHGMQPPSTYKHIDLYVIARRHFGFTSNKLAYLTDRLCKNHKKGEHHKYPGFSLWKACLEGKKSAWKEMEKYNKLDVTSLEELYYVLVPWESSIDFSLYSDSEGYLCKCGCTDLSKNGYSYTPMGKWQRYRCKRCGSEVRGRKNMFSKEKMEDLKVRIKE